MPFDGLTADLSGLSVGLGASFAFVSWVRGGAPKHSATSLATMKLPIVAEEGMRLGPPPQYRAELLKLRASILARYATELETHGFFWRWWLRCRIALEYRREKRRLAPSAQSLYSVKEVWPDRSGV